MPPHHVTVGAAGHIDHGKTAIVRALTGVDADRLPEERSRGITIDLGFAHLDHDRGRLAFVDVPGHERFVGNMLAGAAAVDLAMLVVAADDAVMPQTREHLAILRLLGLRAGVVAVSKADLVDAAWLDLVEQDVRELTAGTFLEDAPIVRTSSRTGLGIDDLRDRLIDAADRAPAGEPDAPFRMMIDRSFVLRGLGTVVTGTVWSGAASAGDQLEWLPRGDLVRVKQLHSHGDAVDRVSRGMRAAVNLPGVHHTDIARGDELATPGVLRGSRLITCDVRALDEAPRPLRHRARVRLHIGAAKVMATLRLADGAAIEPGGRALAQLACDDPVTPMHAQPFVLRSESPVTTIGGGTVLHPEAPAFRRADGVRRTPPPGLLADDDAERADAALRLWRADGVEARVLWRLAGIPPARAEAVIDALLERGELTRLGAGVVHASRAGAVEDALRAAVTRRHETHPLEPGRLEAQLLAQVEPASNGLGPAALERLIGAGELRRVGDRIARADFAPKLSAPQAALRETLRRRLREGGCAPDSPEAIAGDGAGAAHLGSVLTLLVATGEVVHIGQGVYLHAECERAMREAVRAHLLEAESMTMSRLRTLLSTSRKFAVPIGEHLDRVGLTMRRGDERILTRGHRRGAEVGGA